MDYKEVKELIQKSKKLAKTNACKELVEDFERFVDLYHDRTNPDPTHAAKLSEAQVKFLGSFGAAAASFGITSDVLSQQMTAFLTNPKNATPERQDLLRHLSGEAKKEEIPQRVKKNKNLKV